MDINAFLIWLSSPSARVDKAPIKASRASKISLDNIKNTSHYEMNSYLSDDGVNLTIQLKSSGPGLAIACARKPMCRCSASGLKR